MTEYSINDEGSCGKLIYSARSKHIELSDTMDVFVSGNAEIDGNQLIFKNATSLPKGTLEVFFSVFNEWEKEKPAYETSFKIRIIDCSDEEDYFEFKEEPFCVCEPNSPPTVTGALSEVTVKPYAKRTFTAGVPFDREFDSIKLTEWGFLDLRPEETRPSWISLKSEVIEYGVDFFMSPPFEE